MSQSAIPLNVVAVYEPRLELNNERQWVVIKGGQLVTYYPFPATSFSNSQFNFTCNPPSAQTVLDRAVFIEVPYTITFSQNSGNPGSKIINCAEHREYAKDSPSKELSVVITDRRKKWV